SLFLLQSCASAKSGRASARGERVVETARSLLDAPYRYGGTKRSGFDCSGLTAYVFDKHRVSIPRKASDQFRFGKKVSRLDARPGDLVFFIQKGRINHVGIVTSNRRGDLHMIHSSSSAGVVEESMSRSKYWSKRYKGVRRVL
ncbi:MAG: C40 family peptidase, partial [Saprospiraceae bacterium]|nr:C40 family peptidase [Saprospiraceae bacterium]